MSWRLLKAISPCFLIPYLASCAPGTSTSRVISVENAAGLERLASFDRPSSFVNAIIFSADDRYLVTGDRNREVLVWDRGTWTQRTYQPAQGNLQADDDAGIHFYGTLAVSPDGGTVITTSPEGEVKGRDWEGNELFTFPYGARVYSTAISPDGKYLAVGGVAGNIVIYDLQTGHHEAGLSSDREYISFLVFSPDGTRLVAGYERPANLISTWSTGTWQEISTLTHAADRFDYHDAVFFPDGSYLAIATTLGVPAGDDNAIEFLDLDVGKVVRQLARHSNAPYQIAFSPEGSLLAAAMNDGLLRLIDVEGGEVLKVIRNEGSVLSVAFSPDGSLLAFSVEGEGLQIWSVGEEL